MSCAIGSTPDGSATLHAPRLALLARAAAFLSIVLLLRRSFDVPFYFDEIWRVDYVTTRDLLGHYFRLNTGLPIGWIYLHRALLAVLPNREVTFRILSLLWFLVFLECAWRILRRDSGAGPVLLGAMALLAVLPGLEFVHAFNNYSFEMAYAAALLLLVRPPPERATRRTDAVVLLLLALSPLFVLPAPFFVPWLYLEAWRRRSSTSSMGTGAIAASAALCLVSAGVQYLFFMRPLVDDAMRDFWAEQRVVLDLPRLGALARHLLDQSTGAVFRDSIAAQLLHRAPRWSVNVFVAALLLGGAVALFRRSRSAFAYGVAAVIVSSVASAVTGWPSGPVRVNASFWWVLFLATLLAWCGAFAGLARACRLPVVLGVAAAVVVAYPWVAFTRVPSWTEPYGRGFERDVRAIARSPARGNLVVSYHFMSWYYPEYFLNSRYRSDREFKVLRDVRTDDRLYARLDEVVRAEIGDRAGVWCILPYDNGTANDRACQLHLPGFRRIHDAEGIRARVIGYVRER